MHLSIGIATGLHLALRISCHGLAHAKSQRCGPGEGLGERGCEREQEKEVDKGTEEHVADVGS